MLNLPNHIISAHSRINKFILKTTLRHSEILSHQTQANIYLKCENEQHTHSFKVRGAFNKLLNLTPRERLQGVVAASSGNHGAALAYAGQQLNIACKIFVPEQTPQAKVENILRYQADLAFYATDCVKTESYARAYALEHNKVYVSPYNDLEVVSGQGTIGIELQQQLAHIDVVLVPVGGGGLIAGIAAHLKSVAPHIKIIGCLPEHSPVMAASVSAGQIVDMPILPTLSDATAGGIEADAITFELCQRLVDDYILLSETQIKSAMDTLMQTEQLVIEGAAGLALGALLNHAQDFKSKNVVVVLSGGNYRG